MKAEDAVHPSGQHACSANSDPRRAATLGEAARNANGTYDGAKALAWLTEALNPGHGIPAEEVRQQFDALIEKKRQQINVK